MAVKKRNKNSTTNIIAIYDPKGDWYNLVAKGIEKHDHLLYEDEKKVGNVLRLMIKHFHVCMIAIAKARLHRNDKANQTS